jgi:hypothetical protein
VNKADVLKPSMLGDQQRLLSVHRISESAASRSLFHRALVAHTCNPSYSQSRNQEDCGSKPSQGKEFGSSYLEKTRHTKKGLVERLKW